jgi:hypothetical protein
MNKLIKHGIGLSVVAFLVGACVSAQVDEPSLCDTKSVSWNIPTLPPIPSQDEGVDCSSFYATVPSTSTSTTFDFSDAVSKIDSVANSLSVVVNQLMIDNTNNDFSWVEAVNVSVSRNNVPNDTPVPLANYTMPDAGAGSELNIDVVMPSSEVLQYLSSGPLTLTVSLVGGNNVSACEVEQLASMTSIDSTVHMCLSASGSFSKSL